MTAAFLSKAPIFNDPTIIKKKKHRISLLVIARIIYFSLLCFMRKGFEFFLNCPRTIT